MSQDQTLDVVRERLKDPNNLPMKVEILWTNKAAEELRDKTVRRVREMGTALQTEVSLGRWRSVMTDEIREILVQPGGRSQLIRG